VPVIEPHTLGHAYGDLTGTRKLFGPALDVAARVRREIWGRLGLPVTVGLAGNKVVSEVAAHMLKPEPVVDVRPGEEPAFLAPHPLAALPGADARARDQLARYNVARIGALAILTRVQVEGVLGRCGAVLHARANGIDPRPVQPPARREALRAQRTLGAETNDRDVLAALLRALAEQLGRALRARGATTNRPLGWHPPRASDLRALVDTVGSWFTSNAGARATAVGLVATLGVGYDVQLSLFDPLPPAVRRRDLNDAIDRVRRRYGTSSIRYAH